MTLNRVWNNAEITKKKERKKENKTEHKSDLI